MLKWSRFYYRDCKMGPVKSSKLKRYSSLLQVIRLPSPCWIQLVSLVEFDVEKAEKKPTQ